MITDRRRFLQLLGASAMSAAFPKSISRALELPARGRTGTIADVEHIVILMQENRSFDHYFGTLRGVRGFGDPAVAKLPSGDPVWYQPDGERVVAPFHPSAPDMGKQFLVDLPHGWQDTQQAFNHGHYDAWIAAKSSTTMAYLTREDIPYHYALADAFTICDAYYCSFLGATDPNRYHMWTGWVGNDGKGGGPVLDNSESGYDWMTFPERLQKAGISWKIYQDAGEGLDAEHAWGWGPAYIGNYGDNSLLYFHQYQNAQPGSPLYQGARLGTSVAEHGTLFDDFRKAVMTDTLPQVSWIVAPEAYTEHPNWPANYGAWYVSQILDALTANPDVWGKTVFFLNYDENDGFFDHMIPPTPPGSRSEGQSTVDTKNEIFPGNDEFVRGPIGLGMRVPMLVISPWSKGGWVSSEVFDHTSLLRFIEQRFAQAHPELRETNITNWRRAVVGDLTATLDFQSSDPSSVMLPTTTGYEPPDREEHADYVPDAPRGATPLPVQEPGVRPARAVPYELNVASDIDASMASIQLTFENEGKSAAVLQVRSGAGRPAPRTYTISPRSNLNDTWSFNHASDTSYELAVHGPNGFLRTYAGSSGSKHPVDVRVTSSYANNAIQLDIQNRGRAVTLSIWDEYSQKRTSRSLRANDELSLKWTLDASYGWYDLTVEVDEDKTFAQRLAGHIENGQNSVSDPQLGGSR